MESKQIGLLLFCIAGIYCSYLTQGIVSEHLSTKKYGPQQERFPGLVGVNGLQSLVCFLWAWALLTANIKMGRIRASDLPSWAEYWKAGITNCIGPACGMIALRNISYSAQVRARAARSRAAGRRRRCCLGAARTAAGLAPPGRTAPASRAPRACPFTRRCWPSRARWCR
jgi:hypothetical protein